jgi:glycine dehydrogenase
MNTAPATCVLDALENPTAFVARHIGPGPEDEARMLAAIGEPSRAALIDAIVPPAIVRRAAMRLPDAVDEAQALDELRALLEEAGMQVD